MSHSSHEDHDRDDQTSSSQFAQQTGSSQAAQQATASLTSQHTDSASHDAQTGAGVAADLAGSAGPSIGAAPAVLAGGDAHGAGLMADLAGSIGPSIGGAGVLAGGNTGVLSAGDAHFGSLVSGNGTVASDPSLGSGVSALHLGDPLDVSAAAVLHTGLDAGTDICHA